MRRRFGFLALLLLCMGCVGTDETTDGEGAAPAPTPREEGLQLASKAEQVGVVQLYRTGSEAALPVAALGSQRTLTLTFDMLEAEAEPLQAYFYHADRFWERDLFPGEYMQSFHYDQITDLQRSVGSEVRYVHYRYQFPNPNINFRVSGNYILRVTRPGREDEPLFEQPFYVSEQAFGVVMGLERLLLGGSAFPAVQPSVRFAPPSGFEGDPFDYAVCFLRNGRLRSTRCTDDAHLGAQPDLEFYLEPRSSFSSASAEYFVDLGVLQEGGRIEDVDFRTSPYTVYLAPDYAKFAATNLDPRLQGQPIIDAAVRDAGTPSIGAQYVETVFRFVPENEFPIDGRVYVTGSFAGWQHDRAHELRWVPERGRYEGTVLLKQGQYEYRFYTTSSRGPRALSTAIPRLENTYTSFIYFRDLRYNTDRLLAASAITGQ